MGSINEGNTHWAQPKLSDSVLKMFDMTGKVVIITGGTGGIGYEVARGLAEAGANIALFYNTARNSDDLVTTIAKDFNVKAKAYKCSVESFEEVQAQTEAVVHDFGRLDVMIANAGISIPAGGIDDEVANWHTTMNINLSGAYYCAKVAGSIFRKQNSGNLIFTASMSGHIVNTPQSQACYNASKAAMIHLSRSLATDWTSFNARVNSVSPGYIDTAISGSCPREMKDQWHKLTPMHREGDPRELKGAYLYLASDASTFTTGTDIVVDGGYCCW
ncbi:putative NADP-dependent mannitol dehydrogenase [Hyphodiscus hymeniophilus]|uniref:NADP-dependent mannitol dehydrogenase n=1 Tax=Hyphodiscus hymeniophilus TaxID=353542 RepID=A0A9P6VHF9_9HELO|nr:putative NADP-dependent mannitol dehydrogenase [Hyphodiscus hymeniophilus]